MARREWLAAGLGLAVAAFLFSSAADAADKTRTQADRLLLKRQPVEAADLLRRAAEAGSPDAQYRLAMMLRLGLGAVRDDAASRAWLGRAAAQGHAKARRMLERLALLPVPARTVLAAAPWRGERATTALPDAPPGLMRLRLLQAASRGKLLALDQAAASDSPAVTANADALLAAAAEQRHGDAVALLVVRAVRPSAPGNRTTTALALAAAVSPEGTAHLLGSAAGTAEEPLADALRSAAAACRADTAGLLLRAGAVPGSGARGMTPLHLAARMCGEPKVIDMLAAVQEADATDAAGRTSLWYAAARGDVSAIMVLLAHGAAPGFPDAEGVTPLHAAAREGRSAAIAALLSHGAPPAAKALSGTTPLMAAASAGCARCIALLMQAGADPEDTGARGDTALIYAAQAGAPEAARLLALAGADPDRRNERRETARLIAERLGDDAVIKALQRP